MSEDKFINLTNEGRKGRILNIISDMLNDKDVNALLGFSFILTVQEHDKKQYTYAQAIGVLDGNQILSYLIEKEIFQQVAVN